MFDINDFKSKLAKNKAILGVDYGSKRVGLALSDTSWLIASPHKTVSSKEELEKEIALLEITGIVVGYPLNMSGEEGEIAKEARRFADRLFSKFALPIYLKDERMSSAAVERMMVSEFNLSRKKRNKQLDRSAAAYILQGALDQMARI